MGVEETIPKEIRDKKNPRSTIPLSFRATLYNIWY
jgi:hypothetical protein